MNSYVVVVEQDEKVSSLKFIDELWARASMSIQTKDHRVTAVSLFCDSVLIEKHEKIEGVWQKTFKA